MLYVYTFDLDIIATSLEAAKKRGVRVRILSDRQRVRSVKGTTALLQRLRAKGIEIKLRDGYALSDHYTTGSSASNYNVQHNKGAMHTKLLVADSQMVIGSTNFTTSAQCNLETAAVLRLSVEGLKTMKDQFEADFADSEDL